MAERGRRPKLEAGRLAVALRYGTRVPLEIAVLQAAEAWGTAPWEIERAPGALRWLKLFGIYHKARAHAQKIAATPPPED